MTIKKDIQKPFDDKKNLKNPNKRSRGKKSISTPTERLGLTGVVDTSKWLQTPTERLGLTGVVNTSKWLQTPAERLGLNANLLTPKLYLTKPVIEKLSLYDEKEELKYIEKKIPNRNYDVTNSFNTEKESLEFILKNKESNESIPVEEIPSTLAVTDVFNSLNMDEVVSFYSHLAKFPLLGLNHPVGQRIFQEIKDVAMVIVKDINVFRVRGRNPLERQLPFIDLEMFEAPHGFAGHGRYNFQGHGELYVCDSKKVAIKEVVYKDEGLMYEIIEWKLKKPMKLIDLAQTNSPLSKYCSFHKNTPNGQEYLIPNFIAQCAKHQKITGIRYSSVHDNEAMNYVLFDFEENWFNTLRIDVDLDYKALKQI